ncbi:hypothetical protein ACMD2_15256 [Ananas comosus]|uniref:Uncharacterized protein n=1 Tax=Ananas comosus TaxID=4615 RepID=A0A199VAG7_ANACO|nr:hypothetical protein ACMD2_15256 [Ananas comosus]
MLHGTAPLPSLPARKPAVRLPSLLPPEPSSSSTTTAQDTCIHCEKTEFLSLSSKEFTNNF